MALELRLFLAVSIQNTSMKCFCAQLGSIGEFTRPAGLQTRGVRKLFISAQKHFSCTCTLQTFDSSWLCQKACGRSTQFYMRFLSIRVCRGGCAQSGSIGEFRRPAGLQTRGVRN